LWLHLGMVAWRWWIYLTPRQTVKMVNFIFCIFHCNKKKRSSEHF
jgi:hypothetical protein